MSSRWISRITTLAAVVTLLAVIGVADEPGAPPNEAARVAVNSEDGTLSLVYDGATILRLKVSDQHQVALPLLQEGEGTSRPDIVRWRQSLVESARGAVEQTITLAPPREGMQIRVSGEILTSDEGFPGETLTSAQQRFPYIRNSVGLSRNLRNNAVYDRHFDWLLSAAAEESLHLSPEPTSGGRHAFSFSTGGPRIVLTFRPRFYQKHKNIAWFEPWNFKPWRDSVAGWCSWWAYRDGITEDEVRRVSELFSRKLRDFGYRYIQIDDGYEISTAGGPQSFLTTDAKKFPHGLAALAGMIRGYGMKPAIWVNVHFGDESYVREHPDYFIRNQAGEPAKGPWIDYGLDGSNPAAIDALVRPLYRELHRQRWEYVKIDALRHLLYDSIYPNRDYFRARNVSGEQAFRNVLTAARQELGPETYILACWGVLPEAVGVANACRLGWDGFGPATLVQYNSWNNVVWRNDPDHADITPPGEEIFRPVLVSMAGAQLLLTDKAEVYEDDAKIEGAKRSAPVLFTLPGQFYDFDPSKTNNLINNQRNQNGGSKPGPIDADQQGPESSWWMLDINLPFESWSVLARLSDRQQPAAQVSFADLGLRADRDYLVYEFWSKKFLGSFRDSFPAPAQQPKEVRVYAIRERVPHPQVVSTSRHISQGGVDLSGVTWKDGVLSGASDVVAGDPYTITIYAPGATRAVTASAGWAVKREGPLLLLSRTSATTQRVNWRVKFN